MQFGRYYIRLRRTSLGSYAQGFDLLGIQARRDLARYRRNDGEAIAQCWRVASRSIAKACRRHATQEEKRVGTHASS